MSYIINSDSPFVSVKITQTGREKLASGALNFSFFTIGDSEIDYVREAVVDANPNDVTLSATSKILVPLDRQPNLKSYIIPSGALQPFQPLTVANISVIKAVVNNEAIERGFFLHSGSTYTTQTGNTFTPHYEQLSDTNFTGGQTLTLGSTSGVSVGDIMLVKLTNDIVGTQSPTDNITPIPNLWYKIQSISGNTVTVDRNLPNYSSNSSSSTIIIYRGGEVYNSIATGNTTAYWDSGTLSFNSAVNITAQDVPVWNMNSVWSENLAGLTGLTTTNLYEDYTKFGSYAFLGNKYPFLEYANVSTGDSLTLTCNGPGNSYPDVVKKSIAIIHYTNNAISNLYGEFLYIDTTNSKTLKLYLPDLMYNRVNYSTGSGTTQGMGFMATGATQLVGTSDVEFIDLYEDVTLISSAATPLVIGKVFPQLKIITIHDEEIVAAMSYKGNRNWTLPALAASLSSPSGGTSTGVLEAGTTMYISYSLENTSGSGLTTSLPCQEYIKITNTTTSAKDVSFRISDVDLLPYMRKIESAGYDGLGFYADTFKLIYQVVSNTTDRPISDAWKAVDFTSTAITGGAGETIDPKLLENQNPSSTGFILTKINDATSSIFSIIESLNMAPNTLPENLQFGDERFFYGNLTTFIGATIYKTIFDINVNSGVFNSTTNPSRSQDPSTNPPNIKVSEVGIYDTAKNLVCIGKLSTPVALEAGNTILLELSIDF